MRQGTFFARGFLMAVTLALVACQSGPHFSNHLHAGPATAPSPYADLPAEELTDILADLARSHAQKKQLAWWVAVPLVGKPVGPAFQPFYAAMGKVQDGLLNQLEVWAKAHHVDLTYTYSNDNAGRALKIMEDRQEKLVRADTQAQFEHEMLMQLYSDYEWQISEIQALLARVKDPALKTYLENSLKAHEDGSAQILALLRRFKFAG